MLKNHSWKDQDIEGVNINIGDSENIELLIVEGVSEVVLSKDDALAIARHFGLFNSDVLINEM